MSAERVLDLRPASALGQANQRYHHSSEPINAAPNQLSRSLKERVKHHYELLSECYQSLWGEHIHHGYFLVSEDTKQQAQINLVDLLLERSQLPSKSTVLDVGCGLGATGRYLAQTRACKVMGITNSGRQVEIAKRLSVKNARVVAPNGLMHTQYFEYGLGEARFLELDAERMGDYFAFSAEPVMFDCVWAVEVMGHFADKEACFQSAELLLEPGGKLVVADWFRAEDLTEGQLETIRTIEDGMLQSRFCTQAEYSRFARDAGLKVFSEPLDISQNVSKTWDIAWSLVQDPTLWASALAHGRDVAAFLQAFRLIQQGYADGSLQYAVMVFQKKQEGY